MVNTAKSEMMICLVVQRDVKAQIGVVLGISLTKDFGNYLGVPLAEGRNKKKVYGRVLNKISWRLAGWKAKLLNIVG